MHRFSQAGFKRIGLLALLCCAQLPAEAPARGAEDRVKAAVVLQLARFVEWPAGGAESSEFQLCVLAKDRWLPLLEGAARGHTIGGKPVLVRRLSRPQDAAGCNIVVVGSQPADRPWNAWIQYPVLSVSEEPGFAEAGGMVGLVVHSGKVGFELNTAAATRAGLTVSSKLIRLARLVEGRGN
jgi:hypothetical protein